MSRYACRKDENHNDIADGLRSDGWSVLDLSRAGGGVPDLAVGRHSLAVLVEIKRDGKAALTPKEQAVRDRWDGPYIVVISLDDARQQLAALRG